MIAAVVLAAGTASRMGRSKLDLPWGDATIIHRVVSVLVENEIKPVMVVTGAHALNVEQALGDLADQVNLVPNPAFAQGGMLSSIQTGLRALQEISTIQAVLVTLGDQPQIQPQTVQAIHARFSSHDQVIVPSFQNKRGHPWLLGRRHWPEVLAMRAGQSLRDFLNRHADEIEYVLTDSVSVLQDLDTPDDYISQRPGL